VETPRGVRHDIDRLQARICAEFGEMPGLILTLAQAARLFSINTTDCERIFRTLLGAGVLTTDGRTFRSGACFVSHPSRENRLRIRAEV
jgi:hypothetical protein